MINNLVKQLGNIFQNSFVRSTGILVVGTVASQGITILSLPILTRLYSPQDFSVLAVYVSFLTIISSVTCLRLEIAIPLPDSDEDAASLLALALCSAFFITGVTTSVILFWGAPLLTLLRQPGLIPYIWLLPVGVCLTGCYAAMQYWATRKGRFSIIAQTRLVQVGSGVGAQLGLGWAGVVPFGLLVGHMITSGAGAVRLARLAWCNERPILLKVGMSSMWRMLNQYKRFPKYSTFEALANNGAIQIPVIMIAALAIGPESGFVLLATRAMGTPVTLIGGAVAQVYLAEAPAKERGGQLTIFTTQVLSGLMRAGVGPLVFISIVAPIIFAAIFGEEWRRAGELVRWMTPWFILKLLSSPVSMVMHVRMLQRTMLSLMMLGLAFRVLITLGTYQLNPLRIAEGYALSGAVFYATCFIVYIRAAKLTISDGLLVIKAAIWPVVVWIVLGCGSVHFFGNLC